MHIDQTDTEFVGKKNDLHHFKGIVLPMGHFWVRDFLDLPPKESSACSPKLKLAVGLFNVVWYATT